MRLKELVDRLDAYLDVDAIEDYSPKGLQVQGGPEVTRVVSSVTASERLFQEAIARDAHAVLVHHGMFWKKESPVVKGPLKRRLKLLLDHDISLLSYHLPLDRHPVVGNNILAARGLGLEAIAPWGLAGATTIGYAGVFPEPLALRELQARVATFYGRAPLVFGDEGRTVHRVGIVSGGAEDFFRQAITDGLDCFITGEAREWVMHHAEEAEVAYMAAGHYATERVGILALGEWMTRELNVEVEFVEVENPV